MNIWKSTTVDKGNTPKDIITIQKILSSFGIEEYEKNTLNFLSEFLNSYITEILLDAKRNMTYCSRTKINIDDIKLAVNTKQNKMYKSKPEISEWKSISKVVNEIPLPNIPDTSNILLPPMDNNLLRNNFQIYNEDLADFFNSKMKQQETTLNHPKTTDLKPDDITMIGLKRKEFEVDQQEKIHKKRIRLSLENNIPQKKHRKLSWTQPYKMHAQEKPKEEENNSDAGEQEDALFDGDDMDDNRNDGNNEMNATRRKGVDDDKFEPIQNNDEDDDLEDLDF